MSEPEMTTEERAAMRSINRHFTFREMTAFLVGYRLARPGSDLDEAVQLLRIYEHAWRTDNMVPGRVSADAAALLARFEKKPMETCGYCDGDGVAEVDGREGECGHCGGTGRVEKQTE